MPDPAELEKKRAALRDARSQVLDEKDEGKRLAGLSGMLGKYPPKPLQPKSQLLALLTTPFKYAFPGVLGWIKTKWEGTVTGTITAAHKSTDCYLTLDIEIDDLEVDGKKVPGAKKKSIRVEVSKTTKLTLPLKTKKDLAVKKKVKIKGRLKWDMDGFWEIHPKKGHDISLNVRRPQGDKIRADATSLPSAAHRPRTPASED